MDPLNLSLPPIDIRKGKIPKSIPKDLKPKVPKIKKPDIPKDIPSIPNKLEIPN